MSAFVKLCKHRLPSGWKMDSLARLAYNLSSAHHQTASMANIPGADGAKEKHD